MITLSPAYGRDYKSKKAVIEALNGDVDFIINEFGHPYDGLPCHAKDLAGETVKVRYGGLRKVFIHKC